MLFKLKTGFEQLSHAEFLVKAQAIETALTSEPALTLLPDPWPAPYPSRVQLTAAFTAFENALDAANNGGRIELDTRDQTRAALITLLKNLAPYLESVAKAADDITILDATGYDRRQPSEPIPQPPAAPTLSLRRGRSSGMLIAKVSRPKGAVFFETQRCTGDPNIEANWNSTIQSTSSVQIKLPGCTPGTLYYVRTRAVGSGGPGPWSDIANLMAV